MKPTALIVDDSALSRRMARRVVERFGYQVQEATNGADAVAQCAAQRPDLILLDLLLGSGMDGDAVLNQIREVHPKAKVVAVTADVRNATESRIRQAGAAGYIHKPLTAETLAAALAEHSPHDRHAPHY
jgi:two-component system, chemotaxis family, chemotaxis protein CheY